MADELARLTAPVGIGRYMLDTISTPANAESLWPKGEAPTVPACSSLAYDNAFAQLSENTEAEMMKHYLPMMKELYATKFTAEEIRLYIAFFKTPLGRKWAGTLVAATNTATQASTKYMPILIQVQPKISALRGQYFNADGSCKTP